MTDYINYPGGYAADLAAPTKTGTFATPGRMFKNMFRELRQEIAFADFQQHARSVLSWQSGLIGNESANNNSRLIDFDPGVGGKIQDFASNYPLLASMLINDDASPLTIIGFAEQQYFVALASLDRLVTSDLALSLAAGNLIFENYTIDPDASGITSLVERLEANRASDDILRQVFFDTTVDVTNWPATLPSMGLWGASEPAADFFDEETNTYVIKHHDGHLSALAEFDAEFNKNVAKTVVTHSDDSRSTGIFSAAAPIITPTDTYINTVPINKRLYVGQLWVRSTDGRLFVFAIDFDSAAFPETGAAGQIWYNRSSGVFYDYNSGSNSWEISLNQNVASHWKPVFVDNIRNSLTLAVEQRLYDSVHAFQELKIDADAYFDVNDTLTDIELASFAQKYGYDRFAPDYIATNAFTWNYKFANLGDLEDTVPDWAYGVPARWYDIYYSYFEGQGLPSNRVTSRPDLYPWKLGTAAHAGSATKPSGWDTTYFSIPLSDYAYDGFEDENWETTTVKLVSTISGHLLSPSIGLGAPSGLTTIDGVAVNAGDRILLINQANPNYNGLYIASSGAWTRTSDIVDSSDFGLTITVTGGLKYSGAKFMFVPAGTGSGSLPSVTINVDPLIFKLLVQDRVWGNSQHEAMWDAVKSHVGFLTFVNKYTGQLLPPYFSNSVSSYDAAIIDEALTHVVPTDVSIGYELYDNGPIELAWKKSLEYRYSMLKIYFKSSPLEFLDKTWGETYITDAPANSLRIERNLSTSLPHTSFKLHGEKLNRIVDAQEINFEDNDLTVDPVDVSDLSFSASSDFRFRLQDDSPGPGGSIQRTSTFDSTVTFTVTHVGNTGSVEPTTATSLSDSSTDSPSYTIFSVYVDDEFIGHVLEGVPFSFGTIGTDGYQFNHCIIDDLGIPFEFGDKISLVFSENTITETTTEGQDFIYTELGCEGCVNVFSDDVTTVSTSTVNWPTYIFTPSQVKVFKGFGQIFTNLLRYNYIDTDTSSAIAAYRNWDVKLVHRFGATIKPDSLSAKVQDVEVPTSAYSVMLKKAIKTDSLWISALRVQLVEIGDNVLDRNTGLYVPSGDASNWLFRVESYNPNYPAIEHNVLDTSGQYFSFKALGGENSTLDWKIYSDVTSTTITALPQVVTGLQNVLNLIYGYVSQLEEIGFKPNESTPIIDSETGRSVNWQLEVEKFINSVYTGVQAGYGFILNPFMDKLYVETPIGLLGRYSSSKFTDPMSTQALYDVTGTVIPVDDLNILRTDNSAVTFSKIPVFSGHLFTDKYEHALVGNAKYTADLDSSSMFDQFLGQAIDAMYMTFYRQREPNGKPVLDGYFISGDNMLRNPVSAIDSLASAYDSDKTFNEPKMAEHALALVGFRDRDYFDDIGITDDVQLNFWKGMINAKGTNLAIKAFTNHKNFLRTEIDEYWAYKIATYGDSREKKFPELKVEPRDFQPKFVNIYTYEDGDTSYPNALRIEHTDDLRWFGIDDVDTFLRYPALQETDLVKVNFAIGESFKFVKLNKVFVNSNSSYLPIATYGAGIEVAIVGADLILVALGTLASPTPAVAAIAYDVEVSGYTWVNRTSSSPIKLFNYETNQLISTIGLWHPAAGIHYLPSMHVVDIQSDVDPANYSYSTQTSNNPNYQPLKPWGKEEVGRVWWDTSTRSYLPYYDAGVYNSLTVRESRWGTLTEYASVDLYEWTESSVHPSEYDAQAALEEGDSSIDQSVRLTGRAGFSNIYSANRNVFVKPIAWSKTSASTATAHPAFGADGPSPALHISIWNSNNRLIADAGRLADIRISEGVHFGAWDPDNLVPLSEVIVGDIVIYDIGTETEINTNGADYSYISSYPGTPDPPVPENNDPDPALPADPDLKITDFYLEAIPNSDLFGTRIGKIRLVDATIIETSQTVVDESEFSVTVIETPRIRMIDSTGFYEDVDIADWAAWYDEDVILRIPFEKFGVNLVLERSKVGVIPARQMLDGAGKVATSTPAADDDPTNDDVWGIIPSVTSPDNDFYIREAVNYFPIIELDGVKFGADPLDTDIDYEWKTWEVPEQEELDVDLKYPRNKWLAYVGEDVAVSSVTRDIVDAMQSADNTLTTVDGDEVSRYTSTWSDWVLSSDTHIDVYVPGQLADRATYELLPIDLGLAPYSFDEIDASRLSIYVNGLQIPPAEVIVDGTEVSINTNSLAEIDGTYRIHLLYRKYQPSDAELEFDPDNKDDLRVQTRYKKDYQYTEIKTRDSTGNTITSKYYFWVQDKTLPKVGKTMSLEDAKDYLIDGDTVYATMEGLDIIDDDAFGDYHPEHPQNWLSGLVGFHLIGVSGLGTKVNKNSTFKLRFLSNYTLRDDPEEMNLKNVHTEWQLLRKKQGIKIPEQLWNSLTDSMCGSDIAGNPIPSVARQTYDSNHGTRTRYGLGSGQTMIDAELAIDTVVRTILNTNVTITVAGSTISSYISFLNITDSTTETSLRDDWFGTSSDIRTTMTNIYTAASTAQVNELFFAVLEDALASSFELADMFKTSMFSVDSSTIVEPAVTSDTVDDFY